MINNLIVAGIGGFFVVLLLFFSSYLQNSVENFYFWNNKRLLASLQQEEKLFELYLQKKPLPRSGIGKLDIKAKAALSLLVKNNGQEKVLFQKNIEEKLPIASLTKLLVADVVVENYDLNEVVVVSKKAVETEGDFGELKVGERLKVKDLLYVALMESSNDAVAALTEKVGEENFIKMMQAKVEELNLKNSFFINPTGLDPDKEDDPFNYSTAKDLALLMKHLLKEPLIMEIISQREYTLYTPAGELHHVLKNSNELLFRDDGWTQRIIGGKTGWTPLAGGCLVLVLKAPQDQGVIINVILGTPTVEDRFEEMVKLVNWINKAYIW